MDILTKIRRKYYTYMVRKQAKEVGSGLRVNGKSRVTDKTVLGNNVNFNGMEIFGTGRVRIGNYFHSGQGCRMITDIPPCAIAGGHPARIFKYRDKEHYYKLKNKKQFH